MPDGSRKTNRLAPAVGHSLAALLPVVFTMVQIETAAALDVGVSGAAAGVGAGLNSGIGSDGLSAGVGVSNGGNGASASGNVGPSGLGGGLGVDAGSAGTTANAGIGSGQQGLSGGAGSSLGGNGTLSGGSSSSASPSASGLSGEGPAGGAASASVNTGNPDQGAPGQGRTAGTIASIAPTARAIPSLTGVALPQPLWPYENGASDSGWFRSVQVLKPLQAKPGTPLTVVQSCRNALVSGASRYGAIRVDVASAGRLARLKDGSVSAPVEARIVFRRGDRVQVRQAPVTCRLDARGRMLAMF
jgi:hypothetical protein